MTLSALLAAAALPSSHSPSISQQELLDVLRILCHPRMEGRLTLAPGEKLAADYLAAELRRIGLQEGPNKGYIHRFPITVNSRWVGGSSITFKKASGSEVALRKGIDWAPMAGSNGRPIEGQVVYAGFGIKNDSRNDYAGLDLKGKIALIKRGQPAGLTQAVLPQARASAAKEAGAVGVIFAGPFAEGHAELPTPTRRHGIRAELDLSAAGISSAAFERITGMNLRQAWKSDRKGFAIPATVSKTAKVEPNAGEGLNVIGYLPGNDPKLKDEIIVIGAHYDHLGFGEVGSRTGNEIIHPGADDNASGVAGVLELAEHFAASKSNKRTMVFQLYSGEEVGLVGARLWVQNNPQKVGRISAMINMDMIGRLRDENLTVFATSSSAEFEPMLNQIKVPGVKFNYNPTVAPNSDHAPFAQARIPVLFFHTGLTAEYHTENDTIESLNMPGMVAVLEAVKQTVERIDARPTRLPWNPNAQMPQRRTARLGLTPDMNSAGQGVGVMAVAADSPAAAIGLKAGDRVVELNGRPITNMEQLQAAFQTLRPGAAVKIVVMRGSERIERQITPQ